MTFVENLYLPCMNNTTKSCVIDSGGYKTCDEACEHPTNTACPYRANPDDVKSCADHNTGTSTKDDTDCPEKCECQNTNIDEDKNHGAAWFPYNEDQYDCDNKCGYCRKCKKGLFCKTNEDCGGEPYSCLYVNESEEKETNNTNPEKYCVNTDVPEGVLSCAQGGKCYAIDYNRTCYGSKVLACDKKHKYPTLASSCSEEKSGRPDYGPSENYQHSYQEQLKEQPKKQPQQQEPEEQSEEKPDNGTDLTCILNVVLLSVALILMFVLLYLKLKKKSSL